ncbi:hypothetical protein HGRIS_006275 [Hohenbuehelia grisea]|uniref:Uncharacterized protein n=1 Tax=Hohenbuehelia grisea TaxID=104357 RepID=A0ABR3JZN9_9AGAR
MPNSQTSPEMDLDTCWCPVCDKQIQPKRFQVPITNQPNDEQATAPPPPPSSPQDEPRKKQQKPRQRVVGGLVQGTGRVKPNGALRHPSPPKQHQPQVKAKPTQPIKYRTVIDQGPLPLFCSDTCKQRDWDFHNPPSPITDSDDSTSPSSLESDSSLPSPPPPSPRQPSDLSPSIATLARIYNFPPLPPVHDYPRERDIPRPEVPAFNSGMMMAARHLEAIVPPKKPRRQFGKYTEPPEPIKIIPGWNDGTSRWRACVYGFAPPPATLAAPLLDDELPAPYKTCVATPHRGRSNANDQVRAPERPAAQRDAETEDLLAMYAQSFKRQPRLSPPASTSETAQSQSPRRRERSLVHPDAEGQLLVPNVKMRLSGGSSASLSSVASSSVPRRSPRSPLAQPAETSDSKSAKTSKSADRSESDALFPSFSRPTFETRSWSYDNVMTYPVMQVPAKKVKKVVKQVVDGVEQSVEVEVDEEPKRLFLFADTVVRRK